MIIPTGAATTPHTASSLSSAVHSRGCRPSCVPLDALFPVGGGGSKTPPRVIQRPSAPAFSHTHTHSRIDSYRSTERDMGVAWWWGGAWTWLIRAGGLRGPTDKTRQGFSRDADWDLKHASVGVGNHAFVGRIVWQSAGEACIMGDPDLWEQLPGKMCWNHCSPWCGGEEGRACRLARL